MFDDNPAQQTAFKREKSYHPSDYPHVFTFSLVWDVPFGAGRKWKSDNGLVNGVLGGWQLATVNSYTSGSRLFATTEQYAAVLQHRSAAESGQRRHSLEYFHERLRPERSGAQHLPEPVGVCATGCRELRQFAPGAGSARTDASR